MKELYQDYYSSFFWEKRNFSEKLYKDELKRTEAILKDYLPKSKQASILEIGCGVGFVLNYLKKEGYENHFGIDISAEAIALCHFHVTPKAEAIAAIDYLQSIEGKAMFDMIIAFDTINHFTKPDLRTLIRLCYSVMKEHSVLVCNVNNFLHILGPQLFYRDLTHETPLNEDTLTHLFRSAGFSSVSCYEQKPKILKSKMKYFIEKTLQRFIYWICRHECPKILSSKILCVARKVPS